MSVPPPPPPPPPSNAIKSPIPVNNKDLLSSIQKGTKLKKVPEAAKNDRSEVKMSNAPTHNGPQKPTINGTNSSPLDKTRVMPQSGSSANKPFSDIQSVLMNQISNVNLRKTSVPANVSQPARPALKSSVPVPNQKNSVVKAPPPPPQTAKPVLRSSMSEQKADYQDTIINKPVVQPPVKKLSQCLPNQMPIARNTSNQQINGKISNPAPPPPPVTAPVLTKKNVDPPKTPTNFPVIRRTPNPPPPLGRGMMEHSRAPSINPPPVPQRVPSHSNHQTRPVSGVASSQYKVLDRAPPPPPPPMNNYIQSNQRSSSFDQRFQFPSEKLFPKPDPNGIDSRYSQASRSVETFSH